MKAKEMLEKLKKGTQGYAGIPEMGEKKYLSLISKPSATFLRAKKQPSDSNQTQKPQK